MTEIELKIGATTAAGQRFNFSVFRYCFVGFAGQSSSMTSLHRHGAREAHKQLHFRLKKCGLTTVQISVTRKSGRLKVQFSGPDEEVKKARQIFADWT